MESNLDYENFSDEDWENLMSHPIAHKHSNLWKKSTYHISLWYNRISNLIKKSWPWWSEIVCEGNEQIYLGALPLIRLNVSDTSNDLINLKSLGIKAVLSTVEVHEMQPGKFTSPVTSQQWKEAGIKHLQIPTADFMPISVDHIGMGVEFIHWNVQHARPIYIHCKAGRGRSALILACYLLKYHADRFQTLEEAMAFIKTKRPQAKLEEIKRASANAYLKDKRQGH